MKKILVLGSTALAVLLLTLVTVSTRSERALAPTAVVRPEPAASVAADFGAAAQEAAAPAPERAQKRMQTIQVLRGGGGQGYGSIGLGAAAGVGGHADRKAKAGPKAEDEAPAEEGGAQASTRAWFPETFLFEPLVVTDAQGRAQVPVKVPDRLTRWRLLALAHSRQGSQAGAVTSLLGTLPVYVDPVTPPFLSAGDVVRLPVQVVNTTDADAAGQLAWEAAGATLSTTGAPVRVPAGGSTVQYVTLTARGAGQAVFRARLGSTDAIERTLEVRPTGRRELQSRGGTLAAPRTFSLTGPTDALPGSEAARLRVYPGALGLLRAELSAAPGRGGVAEDAYLLQLLGQAPQLLRALGAQPDEPTLRELTLLATQRTLQHARSPSLDTAALLAEAALAHPDNLVLARLGTRLAEQLARGQRADGTCQGETGWTLQRLLVASAECVRAARASTDTPAARQRATAVTLKAVGAFERQLPRVGDGYTAAALLATGAVTGTAAESLRRLVLEALEDDGDGGKRLRVVPGTERADGRLPTTVEATALAILGLQGVDGAPLAELGTHLLSGYSAAWGWGDGRANLVALRAAVALFKEPVPAGVRVTLERDGQALATGVLDASRLHEVLTLDAEAPGSGGAHRWTVRAEPPVPGLGFSLQLVAFAPWREAPASGLELSCGLPDRLRVGQPAELAVTVAGPAGVATRVALALPAGVQPDLASLERLTATGDVTHFEVEDGLVTLHVRPMPSGQAFSATLTVVPTLAGTLQAGASRIEPEGQPQRGRDVAPRTWRIE